MAEFPGPVDLLEGIMKNYEGYIHISGSLIVKEIPQWAPDGSKNLQTTAQHLGIKMFPSLNKARQYFRHINGGRQHVNFNDLKK